MANAPIGEVQKQISLSIRKDTAKEKEKKIKESFRENIISLNAKNVNKRRAEEIKKTFKAVIESHLKKNQKNGKSKTTTKNSKPIK